MLFLDGDKRSKVRSIQEQFPEVAIVFLPGETEFEEVVPRTDYMRAAAEFLGVGPDTMTDEMFQEWSNGRGKRKAFSKEVARWLEDVYDIDKEFKKPLVMQKAIENADVGKIQVDVFRDMMREMRSLLPKV